MPRYGENHPFRQRMQRAVDAARARKGAKRGTKIDRANQASMGGREPWGCPNCSARDCVAGECAGGDF